MSVANPQSLAFFVQRSCLLLFQGFVSALRNEIRRNAHSFVVSSYHLILFAVSHMAYLIPHLAGVFLVWMLFSFSMPSYHSSHSWSVAHGSSGAIKAADRRFRLFVMTHTVVGVPGLDSPSAIFCAVPVFASCSCVCFLHVFCFYLVTNVTSCLGKI